MIGPTEDLRRQVGETARALRPLSDEDAEAGLEELLGFVHTEMMADIEERPPEDDDPDDAMASVAAWTSVVTYAMAEVYAPLSPLPRLLAGFSKDKTLKRLNEISGELRRPLEAAMRGLGAESYSVSVGFPWGISIGLSWS